jgi:urease beta subunit
VVVTFHPVAAMLRRLGVPSEVATRLEPAQRILIQAIEP